MAQYYPRAMITLLVTFEDFKFSSDTKLQKTYSFPIYTHNVTVVKNDYSTADTFTAEIDYKALPFDPRMMRALGVTVHMEDIGKGAKLGDELSQMQPTEANTRFVGFVDDEDISFDDDTRTVRLEGRDFTGLLIDSQWTYGPIALTDRTDRIITRILARLVSTQTLSVLVRGIDANALPTLSAFAAADGDTKLGGQKNTGRSETYWDVIQDIASRSGLIAFVELDKLVLTKPRALYNPANSKLFIYGSNISDLKMKRKLGRKKTFNVVVRSLVGKKVYLAKIPLEATLPWCRATGIPRGEVKMPQATPGGGDKGVVNDPAQLPPAPYMAFLVPNVKDKDHLIEVGQQIYEEVSRQQLEGSFSTCDMGVMQISDNVNSKPQDILDLSIGDPIQILIEAGDLKDIQSLSDTNSRTKFLLARGYSPEIAAAFADSMGKFANVFYTKAVTLTISDDDGFKADIDYINFVDTKYNSPGT